jgi:2-phospho-L-lactate/phosphoenolpyruvate guanylyltransferase
MMIQAIVPVKQFHLAKSRLASVLTPEERMDCSSWMLSNTLECLQAVSEVETVTVVSRDQKALTIADHFGAMALLELQPGLNPALQQAAAHTNKSRPLLVLPSDLPLLKTEDLQELVRLLDASPEVILAPDRHCQGTNALLLNPYDNFQFCFGLNSLQAHRAEAERLGIRFRLHLSSHLGFDLDLPEDLEIFRANR